MNRQYILIGKKKNVPINTPWELMGPYRMNKRSDFGSLSEIRRRTPNYDLAIVGVSS